MRNIVLVIPMLFVFGLVMAFDGGTSDSYQVSVSIPSADAATSGVKCYREKKQTVCKKAAKQTSSQVQKKMMRGETPIMQTPTMNDCQWTCKVECSGVGKGRRCVWVCRGNGPDCDLNPLD